MNPLFSPDDYERFRFLYPQDLFDPLKSFLRPATRNSLRVLDLGCGTGMVAESFLQFYTAPAEMTLADPDSKMLKRAQDKLSTHSSVQAFLNCRAEKIPLQDQSVDLILIGSAWHWMRANEVMAELARVLNVGGAVFVFEYQFPKSTQYPKLNDWVRQQFNLLWKPADQTPRGSLKELTQVYRNHDSFYQRGRHELVANRIHDADEFLGVIVSQSRYLHFEKQYSESEAQNIRAQIRQQILEWMGSGFAEFKYEYESFLFKSRE